MSIRACLGIVLLALALPALAGKPGAGLSLQTPGPFQLEPGRVQELALELVSTDAAGTLMLVLKSEGPGVEILSDKRLTFDLAADATPEFVVQVMTHERGRHYLMMSAQKAGDGDVTLVQSLGVALQVGPAQAKAKKTDAPEIISLPARETVRE